MFTPYKLMSNGMQREVRFHFNFIKLIFLLLGISTFVMSVYMIFEPYPFYLFGIWWTILIPILLSFALPLKYRIIKRGNVLYVKITDKFWTRKNYKINMSSNPRIIGKKVGIRPAPGGIRIELTSRAYKPYIQYEEHGQTKDISLFPFVSYLVKGNHSQLSKRQLI